MRKQTASLSLFVAVLVAGGTALADVPPPEAEACWRKTVGEPCTFGGAGTCQDGTCSKLDYLSWDRDASASPPFASYACVKCVTGTVTATNTVTATDTTTNTVTATDTNTVTATGTDTNTVTATGTNTDSSTSDDGWCSVAKGPGIGRVGPWLMAAAFSLLFLAGRRRKRK